MSVVSFMITLPFLSKQIDESEVSDSVILMSSLRNPVCLDIDYVYRQVGGGSHNSNQLTAQKRVSAVSGLGDWYFPPVPILSTECLLSETGDVPPTYFL